jgi:hypothetical protein
MQMRIRGELRSTLLGLGMSVFAAFGLSGCGGGGGNGPGGPSGGSMTPLARAAVLDAVKDKFGTLPGTNTAADNQAMVAYLKSRPEFTQTGSNAGGVWAHFSDGQLLMVFNDRAFTDDSRSAGITPPTRAQAIDLPTAKQCRVLNTFDPAADGRADQIRQMLTKNGYTSAGSDATVEGLKNVKGDGVLYIDAHGNISDEATKPQLWMTTNEPYSVAAMAKYDADFKAGRVAYGVTKRLGRNPDGSVSETTVPSGNLIISDQFVSTYWKFSQNSFVFINACSSDNALFRAACIKAGAGLYAGWTVPVLDTAAAKAGRFLVDHMLGANTASPKETPNQRPFDYAALAADMHNRQLDNDGTAQLKFTPGNSTFGLLAPSIAYMSVDEQKKELTLTGIFGTDGSKAKITVGGTEIAVKQWGFNAVIADLPTDLNGDVIITVNGHRSNAVPLTEWTGDLTWTQTDTVSPYTVEIKTHVKFRADVHAHRDQPHKDPIETIVPYNAEQQVSTSKYSASGTVFGNGGNATLTGNGEVPLVSTAFDPRGSGADSFYFNGDVNTQTMKLDISYASRVLEGIKMVANPGPVTIDFPVVATPAIFVNDITWTLPLNSDFSVSDGELNKTISGHGGDGQVKFKWHFTVESAPDPSRGEDSDPSRAVRSRRAAVR